MKWNNIKKTLMIIRGLAILYLLFSAIGIKNDLNPTYSSLIVPVLVNILLLMPTPTTRVFIATVLACESVLHLFTGLNIINWSIFLWLRGLQIPTMIGYTWIWSVVFLGAFALVLKSKEQFKHSERRIWKKQIIIVLGILVTLMPWIGVNRNFTSMSPGTLFYKPWVKQVLFSPTGTVASVTNFSVHTYEIGSQVKGIFQPPAGINAATFSPDGRYLVMATSISPNPDGNNSGVFIWELASVPRKGYYLKMDTGETENKKIGYSVQRIAFSPKSQEIAIVRGNLEENVEIWNVETNAMKHHFNIRQLSLDLTGKPTGVETIAYHPSGDYLVTGGMNGNMFLLDLSTDKVKTFSSGHSGQTVDSAFSSDGKILAIAFNQEVDSKLYKSGSEKGYIELWDFPKLELVRRMTWESDVRCRSIAFSPDGKYLVSAGDEKNVRIWRMDTGEQIDALKDHPYKLLNSVAISPAGNYVIASGDEFTKIWEFPYAPVQ